jgi:hypothetical protein
MTTLIVSTTGSPLGFSGRVEGTSGEQAQVPLVTMAIERFAFLHYRKEYHSLGVERATVCSLINIGTYS